ncbi:MAG: hydrogenase maturation protease [Halobacteriales archaeon]
MTEQVLVGVGNQIMGDDGLSAAVVDLLREDGVDEVPGVDLDHAGTTAFFAMEAMDGADRAIVVDAVQMPKSDPGETHRLVYRDGDFGDGVPDINMHDFSFTEALTAGESAYDVPEEIVVLGMTPKDLTAGMTLSEPVAENVDELVGMVRAELERGGADLPPTDRSVTAP